MQRVSQRRAMLKRVGTAGIATIAGCISLPGQGNDRAIKQGVLMPLTGDLAPRAKPILDGALLPTIQLGGEIDFTIDIREEDTQLNSSTGAIKAKSLANAGYQAITGPVSSGVVLKVSQQVLIPNEIVGCLPSCMTEKVTMLDEADVVFRMAPKDSARGQKLAQIATQEVNANKAAILFVDNAYGRILSQSFATEFAEHGGSVQSQVYFRKDRQSYFSRLEKALSGDPDTLIIIGYPRSGVQLFQDYYSEFHTDRPILVTDFLKDSTLPHIVGHGMNNVKGVVPAAAGPGRDSFVSRYKDEYDRDPGVFTAYAYDATAVCLLANIRGGTNKGHTIRTNMRKVANHGNGERETFGPRTLSEAVEVVAAGDAINYRGASSNVNYDTNGETKADTYEVFSYRDGDIQVQRNTTVSGT